MDATRDTWEWIFLDGTVSELNPGGRGWWTLRPGERSYSATELPGVEESKELVRSTGPWDGVFGFSQGAMLAALVAADDEANARGDSGCAVRECAIIVGAAWPTCEAAKLESMSTARLQSLHVIGSKDGSIHRNRLALLRACAGAPYLSTTVGTSSHRRGRLGYV